MVRGPSSRIHLLRVQAYVAATAGLGPDCPMWIRKNRNPSAGFRELDDAADPPPAPRRGDPAPRRGSAPGRPWSMRVRPGPVPARAHTGRDTGPKSKGGRVYPAAAARPTPIAPPGLMAPAVAGLPSPAQPGLLPSHPGPSPGGLGAAGPKWPWPDLRARGPTKPFTHSRGASGFPPRARAPQPRGGGPTPDHSHRPKCIEPTQLPQLRTTAGRGGCWPDWPLPGPDQPPQPAAEGRVYQIHRGLSEAAGSTSKDSKPTKPTTLPTLQSSLLCCVDIKILCVGTCVWCLFELCISTSFMKNCELKSN
jgi:hypothetical protein